jgi:hypothetical protein
MRTLYDSTTATDIPRTAAMVAGYLPPSEFAWSAADWARFPGAVKVRIAVRATTNDGHVLDVEKGDATPEQAPGWVVMRREAGADPSIYCGVSTWPAVKAAFAAAKVAPPHYWIAHYDGDPTIPAGAIAKQYRDPPNSGGHWDLSAVADYWPGIDPAPTPLEDDMLLTDKLPANPDPDTVAEALVAVRQGVTGDHPAGTLYLLAANISAALTKQGAQLTALAADLAALKAGQSAPLAGTYPATITIAAPSTPGFAHDDVEGA